MKKRLFKAPSGAELLFSTLGFGSGSLGNLYHAVTETEAQNTLQATWNSGVRYFDTAPLYGLGLAETRLNSFLRTKKRKDYVISTKIGRLLENCKPEQRTGIGKFFETPTRREKFDYSYDGVMRSLEFSLERLGLDSVDILFAHDLDVFSHGSKETRDHYIAELMKGGYKALVKMREQGVIKAFGAGINEWQAGQILAGQGDFDLFLLAGRYTLLEQDALNSFLPLCETRGIGIVLGGVYNSGILATGAKPGATFNYSKAPKDVLNRVKQIESVCRKHKLNLPQAALQFPLAHPSVTCVVIGMASAKEAKYNAAAINERLPKSLWRDLKAQGLLHESAPVPK